MVALVSCSLLHNYPLLPLSFFLSLCVFGYAFDLMTYSRKEDSSVTLGKKAGEVPEQNREEKSGPFGHILPFSEARHQKDVLIFSSPRSMCCVMKRVSYIHTQTSLLSYFHTLYLFYFFLFFSSHYCIIYVSRTFFLIFSEICECLF